MLAGRRVDTAGRKRKSCFRVLGLSANPCSIADRQALHPEGSSELDSKRGNVFGESVRNCAADGPSGGREGRGEGRSETGGIRARPKAACQPASFAFVIAAGRAPTGCRDNRTWSPKSIDPIPCPSSAGRCAVWARKGWFSGGGERRPGPSPPPALPGPAP